MVLMFFLHLFGMEQQFFGILSHLQNRPIERRISTDTFSSSPSAVAFEALSWSPFGIHRGIDTLVRISIQPCNIKTYSNNQTDPSFDFL
ncbi:unnamed protein product, partial [Vitis vinifera]